MSYATMQDVLFDLYLSDSEVWHQQRRDRDMAAAKPEPEERGESVAQPKAVVEVRRAA